MKCVNCANAFNRESHAPRILGCGHTFCHFCISTLLDCGELACPTCEHKQSVNGIKEVPLNRALLELIVEEERGQKIPQECLCVYHEKVLKSFCKKCCEFTCQGCYEDHHSKEFGCDEVCFSDDESNLEESSIVENLNDKIETITEELDEAEEELQSTHEMETSFKECYWGIAQYRKYLKVNCEHLKENLSTFKRSKESILQCSSNSEFMDCCKDIFPLKSHPQTARNHQKQPLGISSLRKNFVPIQLAFLNKLHTSNEDIPGADSSSATVVLQREATSGRVSLNHSLSLGDNASMLDIFKEFNSKNLTNINISWPLDAIEGEESKNLRGKCVHADVQLDSSGVETLYKMFSLCKEDEMFTTYNRKNMIELKNSKSSSVFHFRELDASTNCYFNCGDNLYSRKNLNLALSTDEVASKNWTWNRPTNEWPVFASISESAPELVFVKSPIKNWTKSFQLVGTWKMGGDVEGMPETWQSTSWRLSSNP